MREERLSKLRRELFKIHCDAFLVTNPAKIRYLTGFWGGEDNFCLVTEENVYLVVHEMEAEKALSETNFIQVLVVNSPTKVILETRKLLKNCRAVCFENDLSYKDYHLLKRGRRGKNFFPVNSDFQSLLNSTGLIDKISAIKETGEVEKIEKAVRLTEEIFAKYILPQVRPGVAEADLAAEISYWGKKLGAEKDAFDIIVLSGKRSSMPHGEPSLNLLQKGDIVQFDFGYVFDGYPSDFSRVVFLGEPTEKQKEIYNLVLAAQETAIEAVRPGLKCQNLDKAARDIIQKKGYDIPHSLGHGLGILLHSDPRVSPNEETELEPGHVITIEPGIYLPGWGGVRIEDVIVITENGYRNLNRFRKDLIVV